MKISDDPYVIEVGTKIYEKISHEIILPPSEGTIVEDEGLLFLEGIDEEYHGTVSRNKDRDGEQVDPKIGDILSVVTAEGTAKMILNNKGELRRAVFYRDTE